MNKGQEARNKDNLSKYSVTINSSVAFAGLFTALSIFFTGLIITNYDNFANYVRVPTLFLVISTFGFLYSTLIYINATYHLSIFTLKKCEKSIDIGDIISEYMGVYFLIFSIPLVINVITRDSFLRWSVLSIDLLGLLIYHASGLSVMNAFFGKIHYLLLLPIIAFELILFLTLDSNQALSAIFTIIIIIYVVSISLKSLTSLQSINIKKKI